jgi:hypothetical protein
MKNINNILNLKGIGFTLYPRITKKSPVIIFKNRDDLTCIHM